MNKHTPYNLVDENVDIGDGQLQKKNGRKTAKKVQKRSRKSDRSQDVDSKKMKKSESPVQIYKVQTRIFKDFFKNVLPHVGLEQPNWENINSARLVKFLVKFDAAATNFKIKKPRSILTAARCRKVHLDSDSFKEGHLATVLARMLSIADERVLKKHYKSFSSEVCSRQKDTGNCTRNDGKISEEGNEERQSRRAGESEKESCITLADYDVQCYQ